MVVLNRLHIPLVILRAILFIVDVVSDLLLAFSYHQQGKIKERNSTIVFIAIPWAIFFLLALGTNLRHFGQSGQTWKSAGSLIAAIFGVFPAAYFAFAAHQKLVADQRLRDRSKNAALQRQDTVDTQVTGKRNWRFYQSMATAFLLFEVVLESLPQCCLQLSIIGKINRVNAIQLISISSSLWSIVVGLVKGSQAIFQFMDLKRRSPYERRNFLFIVIFFPWLSLHFVSFVPPLALSAGMKASKSMLMQLAYLLLHLYYSGVTTFLHAWPFAGIPDARNPRCWPVSVLLQLFFTFFCLWTSSAWFVALAPYMETNTLKDAVIPDFLWPNSSLALQGWTGGVFNTSFIPCDDATANLTNQMDDSISFLTRETCLTRIALPLFYIFTWTSFFVLVYHLILLIWWPTIYDRCFSSKAMLALIEEYKKRIHSRVLDESSGSDIRKANRKLRKAHRETKIELKKSPSSENESHTLA